MYRIRSRAWIATLMLSLAAGGIGSAAPASADVSIQALPSPLRFVSSLDLECFRTPLYQPPATSVLTRHINPVLTNLPVETHTLGPREKLCVPVSKTEIPPPGGPVDFVRWVDLSCYRITGINVNRQLNLRHLNPLFGNLPARNVVITVPQHLCVPVIKNNVVPPAEVFNLVRYIDLKCYLEQPQAPLNQGVVLRHLNPVLGNLAAHQAGITYNRQLCVPVLKNNQPIPADVFNIVRWVDLEMFDIVTPPINPLTLQIRHINPDLVNLPAEIVTIQQGIQLGLPMAKNNLIPPA